MLDEAAVPTVLPSSHHVAMARRGAIFRRPARANCFAGSGEVTGDGIGPPARSRSFGGDHRAVPHGRPRVVRVVGDRGREGDRRSVLYCEGDARLRHGGAGAPVGDGADVTSRVARTGPVARGISQ